MSKKLTIIITHHNESAATITPLLDSINSQVGIDFNDIEILISNNCDNPNIEFDISKWNHLFNITTIIYPEIKNKLGCSREFAINNSNGDWVIFCDCDDKLFNDYTLFNILKTVSTDADIYHCNEVHEYCTDNKITPIVEGRNYVFLHGKIFKTQILKDIKFNRDELSDHEDIYSCLYLNGFNNIKEEDADITIYDWKFNPASVTRVNNKEHDFLGLPDLIRCYHFVYEDLTKIKPDLNGHIDDILEFIKWKYCQIKSSSMLSDTYELEGLLALFIDNFDPNLDCLQHIPPQQYEESYEDFIHRIINDYRNKTFPEWTYDILYTQYFSKWDIKIKKYREYIRCAHNAYIYGDLDKAISFAKQALEINEYSYKANILLALVNNMLNKHDEYLLFAQTAKTIYSKNLFDKEFENPCTMEEPWIYDELAISLYYNQQFEDAYYWGTVASSKNYTDDGRIKYNQGFYNNVLNVEKGCAWVTLLTNNSYICGEVALVKGLKDTNTIYPIYCVITPDISEENKNILIHMGVNLIENEKIIPDNYTKYTEEDWENANSLHCLGWHNALTKLSIFGLTQFRKIVYIDNDTLIYQNMDDLFTKPHMSAVQDTYGTTDGFCSGLLVIEPNEKLKEKILQNLAYYTDSIEKLKTDGSFNIYLNGMIHDQLILQHFFANWDFELEKHLPIWYHTWVTFFNENGEDEQFVKKLKAIHFVDAKPWVVGKNYYQQMIDKGYPYYGQRCLDYIKYIEEVIQELKDQGFTSSSLIIPE